jgi:hypothetical protein
MSGGEKELRRRERSATIALWMAGRASRNKTFLDRLCRKMVARATRIEPERDFMRDPLIDNDPGFDPDELDRYQRGE